jgi:molybdenum-dependent DNA-binding transcriptional regulator ModE
VDLSETLLPRRMTMERYEGLTPEERARITQIQDLLIERYVEQKEVIEEGREIRAKELEMEINDLLREKEHVEEWAAAGSA